MSSISLKVATKQRREKFSIRVTQTVEMTEECYQEKDYCFIHALCAYHIQEDLTHVLCILIMLWVLSHRQSP
jgi:hypothetical protein